MTRFPDVRRHLTRLLVPLLATAALLAACGGGSSQVESFEPARLLVLGDENSLIVDDGSHDGFKYTVNDRRGTSAGKCLLLPTFPQWVAAHYDFVFDACNPTGATPRAFIHARAGARVDDATDGLAAQIAAAGTIGTGDLVTLMIGTNDIIDLYTRKAAGSLTAAQATAEAVRLGGVAAAQLNRVLATGARALLVTVPDMRKSPWGLAAAQTDSGAAALISLLSAEYNAALRLGVDSNAYDGRNYGLVLADDVLAAMTRYPDSYLSSPASATVPACTSASVLDCQLTDSSATTTLVSGASGTTHLWASDRHIGPVAHAKIGEQAVSRATNNPF